MIWTVIGNSNVTRNLALVQGNGARQAIGCTTRAQFLLQLEQVTGDRLTVTGLETIVSESLEGRKASESAFEEDLDGVIDALEALVKKHEEIGLKITVGHLQHWKHFGPDVCKRIRAYWAMKRKLMFDIAEPQIIFLRIDHQGCTLQKDGVHLTEAGAKKYFSYVFEQSEGAFAAIPVLDRTMSDAGSSQDWSEGSQSPLTRAKNERKRGRSTSPSAGGANKPKRAAGAATVELGEENDVIRRIEYKNDQYDVMTTLAETAEKQDAADNRSNLHKVIFSGIEIRGLMKFKEKRERIEPMKKAIEEFLVELKKDCPDLEMETPEKIFLVNESSMKKGQNKYPMMEVVFKTPEFGVALRQAYGALIKNFRDDDKQIPSKYKGVYLNPALNHRTRVRIEVLKAISAGYNAAYKDARSNSWVIGHLPRPLLKISVKKGSKSESVKTLGYLDAVAMARAEHLVGPQNLIKAHATAGKAYGRRLKHYFLILNNE